MEPDDQPTVQLASPHGGGSSRVNTQLKRGWVTNLAHPFPLCYSFFSLAGPLTYSPFSTNHHHILQFYLFSVYCSFSCLLFPMMPFFGYNSFLCGPLYCQHMSVEDWMLEAVALKSSATIGSHSFSKANSRGVWEVLCFQLSFKFVKTRLWSLPMSAHGTSLSWPCSCWNEYWQQNIIDLIMDQSLWWVLYFYCVCVRCWLTWVSGFAQILEVWGPCHWFWQGQFRPIFLPFPARHLGWLWCSSHQIQWKCPFSELPSRPCLVVGKTPLIHCVHAWTSECTCGEWRLCGA